MEETVEHGIKRVTGLTDKELINFSERLLWDKGLPIEWQRELVERLRKITNY
jgi:hypothetical protein